MRDTLLQRALAIGALRSESSALSVSLSLVLRLLSCAARLHVLRHQLGMGKPAILLAVGGASSAWFMTRNGWSAWAFLSRDLLCLVPGRKLGVREVALRLRVRAAWSAWIVTRNDGSSWALLGRVWLCSLWPALIPGSERGVCEIALFLRVAAAWAAGIVTREDGS